MVAALAWWPFGIALVLGYFAYLFHSMRGKVGREPDEAHRSTTS